MYSVCSFFLSYSSSDKTIPVCSTFLSNQLSLSPSTLAAMIVSSTRFLVRTFSSEALLQKVKYFNPELPVEAAVTPPSSWFMDKDFYELDLVIKSFRV